MTSPYLPSIDRGSIVANRGWSNSNLKTVIFNRKTEITDLPPEVMIQILPQIGPLSYECYKAIRHVNPAFFDARHLVLSNLPFEEIQYFTPVSDLRTSFLFPNHRSLKTKLESHLRFHNLDSSEVSLFIEYKEQIFFDDWFLGKYYTDLSLIKMANESVIESLNPSTDVHGLIALITSQDFKIEVFLTSLFSVYNFKKAIHSPLAFMLDERAVFASSYPFLLDPEYNTVIFQDWNKITKHISPEITVFCPNTQAKRVPYEKFVNVQSSVINHKRKQILEKHSIIKNLPVTLDSTLIDHGTIPNAFTSPKPPNSLKKLSLNTQSLSVKGISFLNLETFYCQDTVKLELSDCHFPKLSELKIKSYHLCDTDSTQDQTGLVITKNNLNSLRSIHLYNRSKTKIKNNTFNLKSLEEVTIDIVYDDESDRNKKQSDTEDLTLLIQKAKHLRVKSNSVSANGNLQMLSNIQSNEVLTKLILDKFDFHSLYQFFQTPLPSVKELRVYSTNPMVEELKSTMPYYNYLRNTLQSTPSSFPLPALLLNIPNLEVAYLLNTNINQIVKPKSLKNIIYSPPSSRDQFYKYSDFFLGFECDMEPDLWTKLDHLGKGVIQQLDCDDIETGGVIHLR